MSSPLLQIGGAHTGLAPANLLELQTVGGSIYYWADRKAFFPCVIPPPIVIDGVPAPAGSLMSYSPWLLNVGPIKLYRSLQTTTASFVVQNVSGDSMQRDVERILRASAFEGALCVYRMFETAAMMPRLELHGTVTADQISQTEMMLKFTGLLNASQGDTPAESYSETCQLVWGSARCGATGSTECQYSFQSCQVVERFMGTVNNYEKNWGEAKLTVPSTQLNRRRKV